MLNSRAIKSTRTALLPGFTLVELLVVTTIIIVLTMVGLVSYNQTLISSRNARRKADLEVVRQALILYKADNGYYPSTSNYAGLAAALGSGYVTTLPTDPKTGVYTYTPDSCGGTAPVKCQAFLLGASLEAAGGSPTLYSISNP